MGLATTTRDVPGFSRYDSLLESCRSRLASRLADAPLSETLTDLVVNGKLLRPILTFAGAEAAGADPAGAVAGAEAIELLHAASLVHDDIIDGATERRGRPAVHVAVGTGPAIVAGDVLLLAAFDALAGAQVPAERVVGGAQKVGPHAQACCRGQVAEMYASGTSVSRQEYFAIARDKTARPFVAAVTIGAVLVGGRDDCVRALQSYALDLGVAYQIRDDVLDLVGEAAVLGKPVGNSVSRGRPLLPMIIDGENGTSAQGGASPESLQESMVVARRLQANAVAALGQLAHGQAVTVLEHLASLAVNRVQ